MDEGSKTHSKGKKIWLESVLSFKGKIDSICKEKDNIYEKLKDFLKWYICTKQPA